MSEGPLQFAPDAEARVNEFLAAVDRALAAAGCSQPERQNVADDLKTQIGEMITARLGGAPQAVSLADVESVLAELDPPEAYAMNQEESSAAAGPSTSQASSASPQPSGAHDVSHHPCGPRGRRGWWHKWRSRGDIHAAIRNALSQGNPFAAPPLSAFDERARRAVAHAKNEARKWRHNYIGTEHVLIGIGVEEGGLGGIILKSLGLDLPRLREEVGRRVKQGTEPVTADLLPITPRSQRSFRAAAQAARSMGSDSIGTEHLLLGLIAVPDGLAAQVLVECGASLDRIKEEVRKSAAAPPGGARAAGAPAFWPAGTAKCVSLGGDLYTLVATGQETGGSHALIELHAPPASRGLPTRVLWRADVSLYVLQGELRVEAGERSMAVPAGGFVNVPRGTPHAIRNAADAPARALLVATPAGIEQLLAEVGTPASVAEAPAAPHPDEIQRLIATAPKYGVEFRVAD